MKLSRLFALGALLSSFIFTGCANIQFASVLPATDDIDRYVEVGKTTYQETRELLGTPLFEGEFTQNRTRVVAYCIAGPLLKNAGQNFAKHLVTLGFGSKSEAMAAKNIFFMLDENNVVKEKYFTGFTAVHKWRVTNWFEAERTMTEAELKGHSGYRVDDCYQIYFEELAKKKNVSVADLSSDDKYAETPYHTYFTYAVKQLTAKYGKLKITNSSPESAAGDGKNLDQLLLK